MEHNERMPDVRLFAAAAAAHGSPTATTSAPTLDALRHELTRDNPVLADVLQRCSFLLDGRQARGDVSLAGVATVDVLPPFAGG